jgi:dystrophin
VSGKFRKFQRPTDFEPKLSHAKRVLDEIEEFVHLIELRSDDAEVLQSQLEHCVKFYTMMSELKTEVEFVVKTGRQVVEKKQVDFPDKLNSQLDALKHQYNELGSQVSADQLTNIKQIKST